MVFDGEGSETVRILSTKIVEGKIGARRTWNGGSWGCGLFALGFSTVLQ